MKNYRAEQQLRYIYIVVDVAQNTCDVYAAGCCYQASLRLKIYFLFLRFTR
jgi:hypothetical protein